MPAGPSRLSRCLPKSWQTQYPAGCAWSVDTPSSARQRECLRNPGVCPAAPHHASPPGLLAGGRRRLQGCNPPDGFSHEPATTIAGGSRHFHEPAPATPPVSCAGRPALTMGRWYESSFALGRIMRTRARTLRRDDPADLDVVTAAARPCRDRCRSRPRTSCRSPAAICSDGRRTSAWAGVPADLGRHEVLILSTQGGIRRPDGPPVALGYHTGHWEVGLLMEAAAQELRARGLHALRRLRHRPVRRPHAGHARA